MTTKFGVFSETVHEADVGKVDKAQPDPRDHGLSFKVAVSKQGKLNDACFGALKPLFTGEPFVEPLKSALQQRNASRKHDVSDRPWRMASPMKQSACPGDYAGTMQGKPLPYEPATVEVKLTKGQLQQKPPNIKCGLANTAVCRQQQAQGIAGEYTYLADPIHQATRQRSAAGAPAVAPFRPVNPPKRGGPGTLTRNFGNRPKGAVGEFAWVPRPQGADQSSSGSSSRGGRSAAAGTADAAAAAEQQQHAAFRPAAFPRKGPMATFNRFPEYLHDPETLHAERGGSTGPRSRSCWLRMQAVHGGRGGQVKTDATRSIMRMNL